MGKGLMTPVVRADYEKGALVILDQTRLPEEEVYKELYTVAQARDAIRRLEVRGAPAIGIAAAWALSLSMQGTRETGYEGYMKEFARNKETLASSRPTAVNLHAALDRMERALLKKGFPEGGPAQWNAVLREEAQAIRDEDAAACRRIGEFGLSLLKPGMGLLTHCNAGHLAVSEYGTALAPIYLGTERGYGFKVYADETRPLLQGARLTAYELSRAGVDVTLICDNMASYVMQKGLVGAVLVGCDRIAANGDTANKIGTSGVAVLARHYGIPFYVLGPTSTIDPATPQGKDIVIEQRPPEEVTEQWYSHRMAPQGINVLNPAFDVTPAGLISGIITEKGIIKAPYPEGIRAILAAGD